MILGRLLAIDLAIKAYTLTRRKVLHANAKPRNIVYNRISGTLMVTDFERAEFSGRQPLNSIIRKQQGKGDFTKELESVVKMRFDFLVIICQRAGGRGVISEQLCRIFFL